jgi:predicted helicase
VKLSAPIKNNTWINIADNDFESLLLLCSKNAKWGRGNETLFEFFTPGVGTARDEWFFDFKEIDLSNKIKFFIEKYNRQIDSKKYANNDLDYSIKWSESLKTILQRQEKLNFSKKKITDILYRPFTKKNIMRN